jgi:hypothetical protein
MPDPERWSTVAVNQYVHRASSLPMRMERRRERPIGYDDASPAGPAGEAAYRILLQRGTT